MPKQVFNPLPAVLAMTGLIALAAGMTSAIAAEPAPKAEKHETITVKVIKRSGETTNAGDDVDVATVITKCGGEKPTVDTSSETKDSDGKLHKAHIIICNHSEGKGITNADLAARLEEARKQVAEVTELAADAKARALASLDAEIARLKAGR
jgi:hypothetical protein